MATKKKKTTEDDVKEYIRDPKTRVFIKHNDETGEWLYSIVVDGSNGFWLDAFESKPAAEEYISRNHLQMVADS